MPDSYATIHWQQAIYSHWYWSIILLSLFAAILLVAKLVLQALDFYRLSKQSAVLFELTPPAHTDKTPHATEELFAILHGLHITKPWLDKLIQRKVQLSLEVVSSREQGIRYIVRVAENDAAIFKQNIISYLPDGCIKELEDFLTPYLKTGKVVRVVEFKQTNHFAYPLATHQLLQQHDPIAYLTGAMTKLEANELIAFQVVISPAQVYEAHRLEKKILANKDVRSYLRRGPNSSSTLRILSFIIRVPIYFINGFIFETFYSYDRPKAAVAASPQRSVNTIEQESIDSIHRKIVQPLFRANIRVLVVANDRHSAVQRTKALRASLTSFSVPKHQSLKSRSNFPGFIKANYRLFAFKHRLLMLFANKSLVLSSSEVAAVYHFPHSEAAKTENVVKSLSQTLPAPISLKTQKDFDLILGQNTYHGTVTPIGLTARDRERHVYIIGGTGNGKTTMLLYAMVQDIKNGKGLAVIDPHGDLAETALKYIPEGRLQDVIYFNPDDIGFPIGMNLLEIPEGLSDDELIREKDLVTEATVSVFRKIFSDDDTGGHRIEYILRNAVQTALTLDNPNLFTVFELLTDPDYRKKVVAGMEDSNLRNFWKHELGRAGDFQRVKMSAGITSKIGRFLFSASAKRILEQPKSTIDFDDIINSGKILICNFSKGLLGEDTSALFGITVLAKLQIATLKRARRPQADRRPFYLYADEFQNFATMSFVQLLSEARKYKLFLLMAEQSTSQQQEQRMVNIILANVGTVVCFRTGNPADEKLLLPMFAPYIEAGDITYLPAFNFYMRVAALKSQEPMSGETLLLQNAGNQEIARRVIESSRLVYARKYKVSRPQIIVESQPANKSKMRTSKQYQRVTKAPDFKPRTVS